MEEAGLDGRVEVDSAGTGGCHEGDGADPRAVAVSMTSGDFDASDGGNGDGTRAVRAGLPELASLPPGAFLRATDGPSLPPRGSDHPGSVCEEPCDQG